LQETAIDEKQKAGDAHHGIVAAGRGEDLVQIAQAEFIHSVADIKKLTHFFSFPPQG
jgi:hypothetical protein